MTDHAGGDVPRDDLRRHIAAACRKWKPTWDRTSHLPAGMLDDIAAAADAYALAYARDCIAAVARARGNPGELAAVIEQLAGVLDSSSEGKTTTTT